MLNIIGSMEIKGDAAVSSSETAVKGKVQYGDVIVLRRTLLDGWLARKRLKKFKTASLLQPELPINSFHHRNTRLPMNSGAMCYNRMLPRSQ